MKMTDKSIGNQSPRISHTPQIVIETPIAEEKAKEGSQLSFAQRVNALPEHDRKAIRKYLPKTIDGLPSSKQREILGAAIQRNNLKAVQVLIKCGVDVNGLSSFGDTPVYECCRYGHAEIVELLLTKGANPNLASQFDKWSPLDFCATENPFVPRHRSHACMMLLLDHGASVNSQSIIDGRTPLHVAAENKHREFAVTLLIRGADPLEKNFEGEEPKLRPKHFKGLEQHFTAALQQGKQSQVDRWIEAVENHLPDPQAASVLAEWAPLCVLDGDLSKRIHTAIARYLQELEGDPPLEVVRYVAGYNAREMREEVLSELSELEFGGIRDFTINNKEKYSVADHGVSLVKLASSRAQDPDEDHMQYVMAILKFVAATAKDAPDPVRTMLHDAVVALLAELDDNPVPELAARAALIRSFVEADPFVVLPLEQVQKQQ
jgi:hypothetical protein